jgi:thioredoxin reductase (NADPH)
MGEPVLLAVDGDPDALARTEIELTRRYGQDYTVLTESTAADALAVLERLRDEHEPVALVLADQQLGETVGADLLARARELHPSVKRGLLIGWGDWARADTADQISTAMTLGKIDYYVLKPQRCPDELFHRTVAEFLFEWARHESPLQGEIEIVAELESPRAAELRDLLIRRSRRTARRSWGTPARMTRRSRSPGSGAAVSSSTRPTSSSPTPSGSAPSSEGTASSTSS